jgi:hypothetical protein
MTPYPSMVVAVMISMMMIIIGLTSSLALAVSPITPTGLCQANGLLDYPPNFIPPAVPSTTIGKSDDSLPSHSS